MNRITAVLAALAASTLACASGGAPKPEGPKAYVEVGDEHFIGTVTTSSPDGAKAYGPPRETVAHRRLSADGSTIEEHVFYDGKLQRTVLTRTPGATSYTAKDDAGSFTGHIRFQGADVFRWARWSYEIEMTNGSGNITGTGERKGDGFVTEKLFSAGGAPRAKITETFHTATQAEYDAKLKELEAQPSR